MDAPYKALVLDFGGVLTTPLQNAMVAFSAELGIELQDLVRVALSVYSGEDDDLVVGFETGRIPEDDFARELAKRLSEVSPTPVNPDGLVRRIFAGLELEESMFDAVAAAREAGLKTGLLSNSWGVDLYPRERLDSLFDSVVISGEVGLRKPDPQIYELAVKKLGVDPGSCVFVDDHPGHLEAAARAGMTTVLHRSAAQTIEELETLLGLPLAQR